MNCVSCVVIFFYLLELTPKTQVSNTMNTVGISSNDKSVTVAVTTDVRSAILQHTRRLADEYATDSLPHRWCMIKVAPLLNPWLSSAVVSRKFETMLCMEIQLITSLNLSLSLDAKLLSTFDLTCWFPFCFCLRKNYVGINAEVNQYCQGVITKQYARVC